MIQISLFSPNEASKLVGLQSYPRIIYLPINRTEIKTPSQSVQVVLLFRLKNYNDYKAESWKKT